MIIRLVKLTFNENFISGFYQVYKEKEDTIRNWEGCHGVKLLQDSKQPNVYFTWSLWESENHLNHYRYSEFFQLTWAVVKQNFSEPPVAWNLEERT